VETLAVAAVVVGRVEVVETWVARLVRVEERAEAAAATARREAAAEVGAAGGTRRTRARAAARRQRRAESGKSRSRTSRCDGGAGTRFSTDQSDFVIRSLMGGCSP